MSPDPSGRRAAISGSIQVPVRPSVIQPGLFADLEYVSPLVGQAVMTGHDTARFTAVWYGLKAGLPFGQVVFIGVTSGQFRCGADLPVCGSTEPPAPCVWQVQDSGPEAPLTGRPEVCPT